MSATSAAPGALRMAAILGLLSAIGPVAIDMYLPALPGLERDLDAMLVVLVLAGLGSLPVIIGMLFLSNACLGLVIPTTMVMALDAHGDIAGLASSLGGTLQMVTGGLMVALVSPFFDGSALPMVLTIALCALAALALMRWLFADLERVSA